MALRKKAAPSRKTVTKKTPEKKKPAPVEKKKEAEKPVKKTSAPPERKAERKAERKVAPPPSKTSLLKPRSGLKKILTAEGWKRLMMGGKK